MRGVPGIAPQRGDAITNTQAAQCGSLLYLVILLLQPLQEFVEP